MKGKFISVLVVSIAIAYLGFVFTSEAVFFNKTGAEWEYLLFYPFMSSHLVVVSSLLPLVLHFGFSGRGVPTILRISTLLPVLPILVTAIDWVQPIETFVVNYLFVFFTGILPVVIVYCMVVGIRRVAKNC